MRIVGPRRFLRQAIGGLVMLTGVVACGEFKRPPPEGNEPEEEVKTAQVTVWGDRYEIFLEHRLIAVNGATKFITHVTDLESLRPRTEGPVTFVLRQAAGADHFEHTEAAPARAGIYIPELTFPSAGEWSVTLRIPHEGDESVLVLPPFTVYASLAEATRAPDPGAPEGISFLKEQQWKVFSKTEPVGKRRLVQRLRLTGKVAARPGSRAAVTPPLAGQLLAPPDGEVPSIGDRVKSGQTLGLVQPPFSDFAVNLVESEARVIEARLALDLAEKSHARVEMLAEDETKSQRELQEAAFQLEVAKARLQAAVSVKQAYEKAGAILLDGDGQGLPAVRLKAPIDGVIIDVSSTVGEYVTPEESLFTILNPEVVYIEARVPEADLGRVGSSLGAIYEAPHGRGTFAPVLGEGGGRVVLFGHEVDPGTRTVPLTYELPNPEGDLRIGMALGLYLETASAEDAIAIPTSAVVDEEGRPVAFVQVSGETFQKRALTLGMRDGSYVQILDGLSTGERVVTRQAYAIRLASVSTSIPAHGHGH